MKRANSQTSQTTSTETAPTPTPNATGVDANWNLKYLSTYSTVEDFWCIVSKLPGPEKLCIGSSYFLFQKGIYPAWEHPANKDGGELSINIPVDKTLEDVNDEKLPLETIWTRTILACIGEQFGEYNNQICGVEVSLRHKWNRVALWIRSNDKEIALGVEKRLKELTGLKKDAFIRFSYHSDAIACGTTHTKIDYFHMKKDQGAKPTPTPTPKEDPAPKN